MAGFGLGLGGGGRSAGLLVFTRCTVNSSGWLRWMTFSPLSTSTCRRCSPRSTLFSCSEVAALAGERQLKERSKDTFKDEYAPVANIRAQLANAKWELEQTTVLAPADGYPTNVQLRPGSFTTAFPITPAMTFVEEKYQVVALFHRKESTASIKGRVP